MMALGITAWVTSRKWTLGPSYVNNSRVIETLPPVTGGRHQPPPPTVSIGQYSPVTLWPGLGDHLTTSEMAAPHQYLGQRHHQSSAETQLRFFVTIILHTNVYCSDVGSERQRTNRGEECVAICDMGQCVRGRGMVTAQMTTDHRH